MKAEKSFEQKVKTPWHFWLIGVLSIFLYLNGAYDYVMMLGHNAVYYQSKHYGEAVIKYFTNYPAIFLIFYTANILFGIIAPFLLLFRTKKAVPTALVSAVAMLVLDILTYSFRNRWNVFGMWISIFDIGLLLFTWGFYFYCRYLAKQGILKKSISFLHH